MDNGACSYRRFLDGDEGAFDEIMKELFDGLVFFINRYVYDIHTAEDLAIASFRKPIVIGGATIFRVSMQTYLFMLGAAARLTISGAARSFPLWSLSQADGLTDERDTPEDAFLADERRASPVNTALSRLPDEMRIAVHLVYFEEMSYEEAARISGRKTANRWIIFCIEQKKSCASCSERTVNGCCEEL